MAGGARLFFHLVPEEEGLGRVRLYNPTLGFGAEVTWTKDTLPIMAQWKCMRSGGICAGHRAHQFLCHGPQRRAGKRHHRPAAAL